MRFPDVGMERLTFHVEAAEGAYSSMPRRLVAGSTELFSRESEGEAGLRHRRPKNAIIMDGLQHEWSAMRTYTGLGRLAIPERMQADDLEIREVGAAE